MGRLSTADRSEIKTKNKLILFLKSILAIYPDASGLNDFCFLLESQEANSPDCYRGRNKKQSEEYQSIYQDNQII